MNPPVCAWSPKCHPPNAKEHKCREPVPQQRSPFLSVNFIYCVFLGKHEKWNLNVTRSEKQSCKEGCCRLTSCFRRLALLYPVCLED